MTATQSTGNLLDNFMYDYAPDTGRHHSYRPDLTSLVLEWLGTVPPDQWAFFAGFRVGPRGQFVAKFMKQPARGGPARLVTFMVDHNHSSMRTDTDVWYDKCPIKFNPANLELAVNTI